MTIAFESKTDIALAQVRWACEVGRPRSEMLADVGYASPEPAMGGRGRATKLMRRDAKHQPISAKELALKLPSSAWRKVTWREGATSVPDRPVCHARPVPSPCCGTSRPGRC